ncbi:nuclease [Lachnotalea glycerini]|nr:nuclease [Lachnotalea glycerini]
MGRHALLSASSSRRWLNCTPSARLEQQFPADEGSIYAEEGTAAHALAEHKLKRLLKKRSRRPVSDYDCDEMEDCTAEYVSFAIEQIEKAKQSCKDPVILIEQHLDFSRYVPEGFGTGDLVIVADGTLFIVELKYGKGIAVGAEENPQMMMCALETLELFNAMYDIEGVILTINQPRLESVSTWEITVADLRKWAEEYLIPRAALADKGQGEFASGSWCRFCKARNQCRARAESFLELAKMEFHLPALLSDEEIAEVLKKADELAKWAADIYAYAQDDAS